MTSRLSWDIFCNVVDNYGDIGVCWRLARQLVAEHGLKVRLWVDDLATFSKICPEVVPGLAFQSCRGVEIGHWYDPFPCVTPAEVVVETFACDPPASYLAAMAAADPRPVWINLEYLSAEDWVAGCHGLPSPHPSLPLVKHFFFPGFGPDTGGLFAERNLAEYRQAFQDDPASQAGFWQSMGAPLPLADETRVSLFGYANRPISGLLASWAHGDSPVFCLVPETSKPMEVASFFGQPNAGAGSLLRKGALKAFIFPFLEQDRYDRLLWACDCNFVRGEDSFLRAQWSARPMVWQIYPQEEGAHWPKLRAFLDLYCTGLPSDVGADVRAFWEGWNHAGMPSELWPNFWRHRPVLEQHAGRWADGWLTHSDLATNLVQFCENALE